MLHVTTLHDLHGKIETEAGELRTEMNARFDTVEAELNQRFGTVEAGVRAILDLLGNQSRAAASGGWGWQRLRI